MNVQRTAGRGGGLGRDCGAWRGDWAGGRGEWRDLPVSRYPLLRAGHGSGNLRLIGKALAIHEALAPFGGVGQSGLGGRSGGDSNIEEYTERRWLTMTPGPRITPIEIKLKQGWAMIAFGVWR